MEPRPFQFHFSQMLYNQLYDDTGREFFQMNDQKEIYSVKQRGVQDKNFVAKKYIYKKDEYIDKIWDEVNSVIKMRNHNHPHVIKYHDIFMFDLYQNDNYYQVCIMIMERGDQTLEQFVNTAIRFDKEGRQQLLQNEESTIKKNKKSLTQQQLKEQYENLVYQYLKQTLSGCKFLKSINIYHRDYKPMNLVLLNNQVKIIDFDIAKITQLDITQQLSGIKGTEIYMDPNLIKIWDQMGFGDDQDDPDIRYNLEKMDIYSIGCTFLKLAMKWNGPSYVIYSMQTKNFYDELQYEQQEAHLQKVTSGIEHEKLKYILCNMLVLDLKKRWNLEECIQEQKLHLQQQNQLQNKIQDQNVQLQEEDQDIKANNNFHWLTDEQIEQIQKEKYTLKLQNDKIISEKDIPQARYLKVKVQYQLQNWQHQINLVSNIINNKNELIQLDINIDYNSDAIIKYLFSNISNLPNLKIMCLITEDYVNLREEEGMSIGRAIQKQFALQKLSLTIGSDANLGEEGMISIGSAIEQQSSLQKLQLEIWHNNNIGEEGAKSIGSAIQKQSSLIALHLAIGANNIGREGAISIGNAIQQQSALQTLDLQIADKNNIGEDGAKSIGYAIQIQDSLQTLQLVIWNNNNIGKEGAKSIGRGIKQQHVLQRLELKIGNGNNIGIKGAKKISCGIQKLYNLKRLELDICQDNNILKEGERNIRQAVNNLSNLTSIDININDRQFLSKKDLQY